MGRKRKAEGAEGAVEAAPEKASANAGEMAFNPIAAHYMKWALAKSGDAGEKAGPPIDPDVQELADEFHIEERHTRNLNTLMADRQGTFEADLLRLWTDLERAHNPNGLLVVQMRQMGEGTFIGKNKPDPEYDDIVKRFNLDEQANEKLLDTLSRHPIERRREYYKAIIPHLESSGKPSATAMMLLRKVGEGEELGVPFGKGKGKDDKGKGKGKDDKGKGKGKDEGKSSSGDQWSSQSWQGGGGNDRDTRDGNRDGDSRGDRGRDDDRGGRDDRDRDRDRDRDSGRSGGGGGGGGGGSWESKSW